MIIIAFLGTRSTRAVARDCRRRRTHGSGRGCAGRRTRCKGEKWPGRHPHQRGDATPLATVGGTPRRQVGGGCPVV